MEFLRERKSVPVCKKKLSKEDVAKFRAVVHEDYYHQMYFDDLPIWAFLGMVEFDKGQQRYYLFNHILLNIYYNKDRVIEITSRTDTKAMVELTEDKEVDVEFLYTVEWKETDVPFEKRMAKYSQSSSLPRHLDIHRNSVINSCMAVLLLAGFLAAILRILNNDSVKYANDEELAEDQEETGWKCIHGDVFRYPKHKSLFAACLGSGTQLLTLTVFIFILALVGVFYPYNRGALLTALVVLYALTSGIAGYTATSFYCQLGGTNWVFCSWTFLAGMGGIIGKNSKAEFQAPCRTAENPREIPPLRWYRQTIPQMAIAGFLPFILIQTELYYIFASVWGHRIYTFYSFLFIIFITLLIVTALITATLTHLQLAAEDHRWWWRSFLCGGSTGLFIYAYCFYYYYARTDMSGFMQTSFIFGYMACISFGCFLMLGTVGYLAALRFVRHVYGSIKCE
ncbi:hypothetical protein H0E87_021515 [Populus deltoides]|uniref:Transmembrane 9 superfamily member n=1 Tax=Populus deltoides TaxID=3696 RepID=A0A8T2XFI4_POPDE|nr:hypothetical protein H0E87_021515 [Populus deltoides]